MGDECSQGLAVGNKIRSKQEPPSDSPLDKIKERKPYQSELEYFKKNPSVGGMATEDGAYIMNPFSSLSQNEKEAVALNEKARAFMRNGGPRPSFEITPEQKEKFRNYSKDDQDIRETIAARILSGDPSAGQPTPQQIEWVNRNLLSRGISGYGNRADGTKKGSGYFGELKRPNGGISTELSIGVGFDGKETQIPLLVPTLTQQEISYLLSGNQPTDEIVQKAIEHAKMRMSQGKSPFAGEGQ